MESIDVVAIVHRIFTDGQRKKGGLDRILENISKKNVSILLIEHPLSGLQEKGDQVWNEVIVSKIINGQIFEIERKKIIKTKYYLRWFFEIFFNIFYLAINIKNKPVLISSDSLNNLSGILFFWKFKKKYFHCVDYSKNRFRQKILNIIYNISFKLTYIYFDLVGTVSEITKNELRLAGAPSVKLIYIPNSPVYKKITIPIRKENVIICNGGSIIDKYNYDFIIELISVLKKTIPNIKLIATGGKEVDSGYFDRITKKIRKLKIEENVIFTGFISQMEIEKLLIKSKIGLSFYSKNVSYYTKYGDSQKIREYALFGIPSIADGKSATDKEMEVNGCGFVVNNTKEAATKIVELIGSKNKYEKMKNNCLLWAKKNDKNITINKLWEKLIN